MYLHERKISSLFSDGMFVPARHDARSGQAPKSGQTKV